MKFIKEKRKVLFIAFIIIILIIIFFLIFNLKMAKNMKSGNNNISQEESLKKILNMSSYTATIEVEVKSNKNTNYYELKQEYIKDNKISQEVLEPSNISGVKIIKEGDNLKLENTRFNLSTFFEKYEEITVNDLDLNSFIIQFNKDEDRIIKQEDDEIILETKNKTLYISQKTGLPTKMEVKDANKNTRVYILYNEVKIDSK